MTRFSLRALAALVLVSTTLIGTATQARAGGTSILGGGSGFAALEIDQWRADTARSPYNLTVNYVAQGSTFGRQQFGGGSFDYGASDIQYMELEIPDLQRGRCAGKQLAQCFVYVPVSAGGLALMYNLVDNSGNRVTNLRLTRQAACKIFTGAITKWNDPAIVATNPQLASFNRDIRPVIRTDGAGESYVFSEFCIAVAPTVWSAFVAQQKSVGNPDLTPEFLQGQPTSVWPQQGWGNNPISVPNADGTAGYVADPTGGPNAITYVAAGYAKVRSFPTASIQNAAGVFTQPDEDNVTIALGYAHERGNGTFQLAFDGPDPRAYFPSTYSYVLAQTTGFDPAKGATLGQFLCYAISEGQVIAPDLRYARLSSALVQIATSAIVQIPGAPSASNCFVAGAPPPPPPPHVCQSNCGGPGTSDSGSNQTGGNASGSGPQSGSNPLVREQNNTSGAGCVPGTAPAAGKSAASSTRPATKGATTTTVPCVAVKGSRQTGTASGETTTTALSGDAELARATPAASSGHSSDSLAIWLLVAGAAFMLALTTFTNRKRTVG